MTFLLGSARFSYHFAMMTFPKKLALIVSCVFGSVSVILILHSVARSQSTPVADVVKAIRAGDTKATLRLLDEIEDVNIENGVLLYEAVLQRQSDVIEKLFAKRADPNVRDDLLETTVLNKWNPITILLLQHGADPNLHGTSPLSIASSQGNTTIVQALIERGADVSALGSGGTPIIAAIEVNKYDAARLLLEHGADPSIGANFHDYPWLIARQRHDKEMLALLQRYHDNCKADPARCK
jgi:ankyrin repeat protein